MLGPVAGDASLTDLLNGDADLGGILGLITSTANLDALTDAVIGEKGALSAVSGVITGPNSVVGILTPILTGGALNSETSALIGSGAVVTASTGNVTVKAHDQLTAVQIVGSAAAGAVGIGASIAILLVGAKTNARILGSEIRAGPSGTVTVDANHSSTSVGFAFAGTVGLIALGAQVLFALDTSSQNAEINGTSKIVRAATLNVNASSSRSYVPILVQLGVGLITLGASASIAIIGGTTTATIGAADIGKTGTVGNVSVSASATVNLTVVAIGVQVGAIALTGTLGYARVNPTISATMVNTDFTVTGTVSVTAVSTMNVVVTAHGFTAGIIAVGASISIAKVNPTVTASLTIPASKTVTAGGNVTVNARHNHDGTNPTGIGTQAVVTAGAGGAIAAVAAVALVEASADTTATLDGTGTITGNGTVSVIAQSANRAAAVNVAFAVGIVGVGASFAFATVEGKTKAKIADSARIGTSSDSVVGVRVIAVSLDEADAYAIAGAGGLLGAAGALADAKIVKAGADAASVSASIGDSPIIWASGSVLVSATATPRAEADTVGVSVGLIAVGVSWSKATASPVVRATVGNNGQFHTGGLAVSAVRSVPTAAPDRSADAEAEAAAGGLVGANGAIADAYAGGSVTASVGNDLSVHGGTVSVAALSDSDQYAGATGIAIGFIAGGATLTNASSAIHVSASVGNDATSNDVKLAGFSVNATGHVHNAATSTAGSGGVIAGNGSYAETSDDSSATATLGDDADIIGGAIHIEAEHVSGFQTAADSRNAAVVGMSGAQTKSRPTAHASVTVGENADLTSDLQIVISSENAFADGGGEFTDQGAYAAAGGVAVGSAGEVNTEVVGSSRAIVGDNPTFLVKGSPNAGQGIVVSAGSFVTNSEVADLNTGGLLAGAFVKAHFSADIDNEVTIGASADFDSTTTVNIGTFVVASATAQAEVNTFGLAAVGTARVDNTITVDQVVNVAGAEITALSNVNLQAGYEPGPGPFITMINSSAIAEGYVRGLIAVPHAEANSHVTSTATVNLTNVTIEAGRNIYIDAFTGENSSVASGKGVGYQLGFIPITTHNSDSTETNTATVNLSNVTATAGIFSTVDVTIPNCGDTVIAGVAYCSEVIYGPDSIPVDFDFDNAFSLPAWVAARDDFGDLLESEALAAATHRTVGATIFNNMTVAGGIIIVSGGSVTGTGTLSAHGGPSIKIINESPNFLVVEGDLAIPAAPSGQVLFVGGATRPSGVTVNEEESDDTPTIEVANNYENALPAAATGPGDLGPLMVVTGDIRNLSGEVNLSSEKGSLIQTGTIQAQAVTLFFPNGNIVVACNAICSTNTAPEADWDSYMIWPGGNPATALPPLSHPSGRTGDIAAAYVASAMFGHLTGNLTGYLIGSPGGGSSWAFDNNTGFNGSGPAADGRGALIFYGSCLPRVDGSDCSNGSAESMGPAGTYGFAGINFPAVPEFDVHRTAGSYGSAVLTPGTCAKGGGSLCARKITVVGGQINVTGSIIAGKPTDYSVNIPSTVTVPYEAFSFFGFPITTQVSLSTYRQLYLQGKVPAVVALPLLTVAASDQTIQAYYDAAAHKISVEQVVAASPGGGVILDGRIMSTNTLGSHPHLRRLWSGHDQQPDRNPGLGSGRLHGLFGYRRHGSQLRPGHRPPPL